MLAKKIDADHIKAMKARDSLRASTLSFLRAQLKNIMIDTRAEKLDDAAVIAVIKKQVKQRLDSIEQYEKGGRSDLAEKEKKEMLILQEYLPEEMTEDELIPIVNEVIKETQAAGMKDMGNVMKAVLSRVAGSADGKMVSNLVRQSLSQL
jgi:uncharacterized protein YqeY